jgi:DNA segregation ATPase FtsK/SpoIIIE-like protein
VANLKKQLACLVDQVEGMREDLEGPQGQEAQTIQIEEALEAHEDEIDVLRVQLAQYETPALQTATPLETEVLALQPKPAKPVEPGKSVGQSVDADKPQEIVKRTAQRTNCSPVWRREGQE